MKKGVLRKLGRKLKGESSGADFKKMLRDGLIGSADQKVLLLERKAEWHGGEGHHLLTRRVSI